jgi:hypothetical protein
VAVVLRPGKTPGGVEVRAHLRRLVRHIRTRCSQDANYVPWRRALMLGRRR